MKKKLFGMIACLAFVFALLPMSVNAETISSVTINGLDYPIWGRTLDTSYTLPSTDISYTKDTSAGDGVTWYEQGNKMGDISDKGTKIEDISKYTIKNNCYYMAEINLCDKRYLNDGVGNYTYFADNVSVNYEVSSRLKKSVVKTSEGTSNAYKKATVYLFFKSDCLYDGINDWPVLSTDIIDNSMEVAAGTVPFNESVFDGYNKEHFDVSVSWKKGNGFNAVMGSTETFVAGQKYQLTITLNSDKEGMNGSFENSEYFMVLLNDIPGEKMQIGMMSATVVFEVTAKGSVNDVSIGGIRSPEAFAEMQTEGFTYSGDGYIAEFKSWQQYSGVEFPIDVTGKFKPNTEYLLVFDIKAKDGYTLIILSEGDIRANIGQVFDYSGNAQSGTLYIKLSAGEHKCNPGSAWEKDATNHWKVCACGEKKETAVHTYDAGVVTKAATESATGVKTYTCSVCGYIKTEAIPMLEKKEEVKEEVKEEPKEEVKLPAKNDVIKDASGVSYRVTKVGATGGTVEYKAPKNKKVKKVTIPATVKINGVSYKVTAIAKNAFKGCSKLTNVTIGKNVTKIGAKAFYGCKKLKNITIKTTKLTSKSVGSKAFSGTPKNARVKVPKKSLKAYKKFLYKKGVHKKAKIGK